MKTKTILMPEINDKWYNKELDKNVVIKQMVWKNKEIMVEYCYRYMFKNDNTVHIAEEPLIKFLFNNTYISKADKHLLKFVGMDNE